MLEALSSWRAKVSGICADRIEPSVDEDPSSDTEPRVRGIGPYTEQLREYIHSVPDIFSSRRV